MFRREWVQAIQSVPDIVICLRSGARHLSVAAQLITQIGHARILELPAEAGGKRFDRRLLYQVRRRTPTLPRAAPAGHP